MDPGSQWKELNKRFYKLHHFNQITGEQKSLDFYFAKVAISQWGGPLAATKNTEMINIMKTDDILKDSIVFFSNSGKIINKVQYKDYEKIVCFQFLEDEQLLVLKQSGSYNIFDPFKGTKKFFDLVETFKKDGIARGLVVNNGLVVQTNTFEFYFIPNAYEPQVLKMKSSGLTAQPDHWVAIPANRSSSGKVEVQIANPEGGIIHIIEDEKRKVYYNKERIENEIDKKLPDLRNIKMISLSPNYKFVSYLQFVNQEWILSVLSLDFEASRFFQIRVDLREDEAQKNEGPVKDRSVLERPQHMFWCGDDCVVLQLVQNIVLVGPDAFVRIKMNNSHFALRSEIDGLRLVTQKKNEILRRLPDSFVNVFQPISTCPGAMLYSAYESFEQKNPIEDDELRSKKAELAQAVMDCIKAGQFEVSPEFQTKLLKAASYGKTFLGNQAIDPNILSETCRNLRVVNALRRSGGVGGRVVTYEQVIQLTKVPQLLVQLLLRYNLHYLAIEVAKYLKLPIKFRSHIYTHWACCKVETPLDDDSLCTVIKQKIQEEKGVSFTEIAHRAIEIGKSQLALKLLENEPSLAKRIPVLLWMASYQQTNNNFFYERALQDAILSKDSNLIFLVIMKFLKSDMEENYKFGILSQNIITQSHLVTYLRSFDDKYLQKYLQYLKRFDECGLLALSQAYQQQSITEKLKFLEFAKKFFEDDPKKDQFYVNILGEQIQALNDLKQELDKEKKKPNKKTMEEKPLNQIMESFLLKDDLKVAQEFAKVYKVPERRYLLTRVKALIQNKNFEELDRLIVEKNKKGAVIPYELVADMLIKAGLDDKGLQMIMKMPDIEEQVYLLIKIGQPKHAAQSAINNKKTQLLYEIRGSIQDPSVLANIDTYLSQNAK